MSVQKQSLSALMDGEADELELRRVLKACESDHEISECWHRFQLVSAIMKRETITSFDLSDRVMMAISEQDDRPVVAQPSTAAERVSGSGSAFSGMLRSLVSMGVAASVTAVVILGPSWFTKDDVLLPPSTPSRFVSHQVTPPSSLLQPVTYGQSSLLSNYQRSLVAEEDMIRSPQGMQRYIDQHLSLIEPKPLSWGLAWLPDGYQTIRHESTRVGEVMVFSNGLKAFSVSVEQLGSQTMPEGVIDAGNFIALGQVAGEHFVTVVGDMPIMVAERIAAAVIQSER